MSSSREGPNPLRPYYIPPSVGLSSETVNGSSFPPELRARAPSSAQVFSGSARDLLSDIDYSDYLDSSPSVSEWLRDMLDRALWRYASTLTAQPFDVAKTILQAYVVPGPEDGQRVLSNRVQSPVKSRAFKGPEPISSDEDNAVSNENGHEYDDDDDDDNNDDDEDDENSYFTSAAPMSSAQVVRRRPRPRQYVTDRDGYIPSPAASPKHALTLKSPFSLTEVLSQLWSTGGPTAPWKATNATFIYHLLLPTLNTFIRSLLSAIVGLPEEDISSSTTADILTVASPAATLVLSFVSSAMSAMILSPIDTARTFLILTPATHGPRSLLRAIRLIPTPNHTIPPHLIPITIIHSSLPNLIWTSTPLFLKTYLSIDPLLHPSAWNLFTFLGSCVELAVRLPLETVLRRAQIATFTSPTYHRRSPSQIPGPASTPAPDVQTIVPTSRSYRGILGTMWSIVYEEGLSPVPSDKEKAQELLHKPVSKSHLLARRRGQGIQGLYRGWRIGMWGIAGIWGSSLLGLAAGAGDEEALPPDMNSSIGRGRLRGGRF